MLRRAMKETERNEINGLRYSIVIPIYNLFPILKETLDSLLAQTYDNWEAICVDDGSSDNSGKIVDEYAVRDSRIVAVHQTNHGVSSARNVALSRATGDYVGFLDGDDVLNSNWLNQVHKATIGGSVDAVRMSFTFWRDGAVKQEQPHCSEHAGLHIIEGAMDVFEWGWNTYTTDGYIWLNFIKRELLVRHKVRFPGGMKINEDIIFNLRWLPYAVKVVQSTYSGYYYRMRETSAWHVTRSLEGCTRYLQESIALWDANLHKLRDLPSYGIIRRKQSYMIWQAIIQWIARGRVDERGRSTEVMDQFEIARKKDILDFHDVPLHWRVGLHLSWRVRSIKPLVIVYRILGLWRVVRRVFGIL